jgi:hypothetical protein
MAKRLFKLGERFRIIIAINSLTGSLWKSTMMRIGRSALIAAMVVVTASVAQAAQAAAPTDLATLRDEVVAAAGAGSAAWVDPASGQVVLQLAGPGGDGLDRVISRHGRVRVERAAPVVSFENLYGGQGMISGTGKKCTTGFMTSIGTSNYIVTAGHCTRGTVYWYRKGNYLGQTYSSVFGADGDYGLILERGVTFHPKDGVNSEYGVINIIGTTEAYVGQPLCKRGNTTGYTCGTVLAIDATVNYGNDDIINGMILTDICSDHGDSGGPLMTPLEDGPERWAYGVGILSGGNASCDDTQRSYFNPLSEVIDTYGLVLHAAG